jgi:PAS domain S-box-containing protein
MLLMLVAFVARILLDPLKAIATSAKTISGGNFDVSLPRESKDEIGDLVRAFREMITAVQRRQREVTEARIKAEREHQRLKATIETVPVALVIVDAETGRIVLQNRTAGVLLGRAPDDDTARQAYWRAFSFTTRDGSSVDIRAWGAERVLQGQVIVGEELVVRHPDGREIPILVSAAPVREDDGRISGAVAAFQDITSLYEVDRLKSEFVSIVSHELRTPLTSIKGALQLLTTRLASARPQAMLLGNALSEHRRLVGSSTTSSTSRRSRPQARTERPAAQRDEVVKQSLQNVEPSPTARSSLKADIRPGVPAGAGGSRSRHPGGREPALECAESGAAAFPGDAGRPAPPTASWPSP